MARGLIWVAGLLMACTPEATVPDEAAGPTWHQDVAPMLAEHCGSCHTDGGIAPYSFDTYATTAPVAGLIADAVESGRMPPFLARETDECQPKLPWANDLRLSPTELQTLRDWVDADEPEGDATTASEVPEPPSVELVEADVRFDLPVSYPVAGEVRDDFVCFVIDPELTSDRYITGLQVVPDNTAVVHHVLVYTDPTGLTDDLVNDEGYYDCFGDPGFSETALIGTWAPGTQPLRTPPGVAVPFRAGTKLVVNVHYHGSGAGTEIDRSAIDIDWSEEKPGMYAEYLLMGNFDSSWGAYGGLEPGPNDEGGIEFRIPAGVSDHVETMTFREPYGEIPIPLPIWGAGTHMHYAGQDMKLSVVHEATGEEECILQTPDWNFDWQKGYAYAGTLDQVPVWGVGDTLKMRCIYDNTWGNDQLAEAYAEEGVDELFDISLGDGTLDEMCLGVFAIAYPAIDIF